jgi:hypothetical protein
MLKLSLIAAAALCAAAVPALAQESASAAQQATAPSLALDLSSPTAIAAKGVPIRVAEAALNRAGFDCKGGRVVDGAVSCSLTSVVGDSSEDSQHEVTLRVQITADSNGAVAIATVRRTIDGV